MESQTTSPSQPSATKRIIARFAHLLSAQGVEAIFSTIFFILLARTNVEAFGQLMLALNAGAIVMKVVQFGLYYPLVHELGEAPEEKASLIVSRVNMIKLGLFGLSMLGVWILAVYDNYSFRVTVIFFLICFGCSLEAMAETFFAHIRVQGRQKTEARVKMVASVSSYGYGIAVTLFGINTILLGAFKLVSGLVRLVLGAAASVRSFSSSLMVSTEWAAVRRVFRASAPLGFMHILGVLYNKTNTFFLQSALGTAEVGVYEASWKLVDGVSILGSEQLLAWVIFPFLSTLWLRDRKEVAPLVRRAAQWLMAVALPMIFVFHVESDFIIRLVYGSDFPNAPMVMRYVAWTILMSFESNLMSYMMIVVGKQNQLVFFSVLTTIVNLLLNFLLVKPLGLTGACLVIVCTKFFMMSLVTAYCQIRFALFKPRDFVFLFITAAGCLLFFLAGESALTTHPAAIITLILYGAAVWKMGPRYLGSIQRKRAELPSGGGGGNS